MKKIILLLVICSFVFVIIYYSYLSYNHSIMVNNKLSIIEREDMIMDSYELKVMTYNIRQGVGIDNKLDLNRIAAVIQKSDVDIISLNEVDQNLVRTRFKNQIRFLAKELKMNYAFGPNIKTGTGSYGNAILSKYPLKNIINHQLPTGENIEPRGVLEVKVTLPFKQDIHIFSTHFTPDNLNRGKQLFWVDYYLKSIEKPYIFMGDLNMENPVLNNKLSLTEELKTYPSANPTHGVDHIFSNASFEILERYVLDSKASDHLPVVVRFKAINLNKKV